MLGVTYGEVEQLNGLRVVLLLAVGLGLVDLELGVLLGLLALGPAAVVQRLREVAVRFLVVLELGVTVGDELERLEVALLSLFGRVCIGAGLLSL